MIKMMIAGSAALALSALAAQAAPPLPAALANSNPDVRFLIELPVQTFGACPFGVMSIHGKMGFTRCTASINECQHAGGIIAMGSRDWICAMPGRKAYARQSQQ